MPFEVVVVDERRLRLLREAGVGLDPGVGRFAKIARQADEREAVVPSDGHQGDHAAGAAVVGHDDAPPLARGRIDDAALMKPESAVVRAGARGRHRGHAQRFALHHAFDLPGAVDRIGDGDHLIHRSAGDGGDVDVLAVDLVEVVAFAHPLSRRNDQLVADVGDERPQVRRQFFDRIRGAGAGDDEDLAEVVIEEHRQVVPSGQLVALPRTLDRLGAEDLEARAVDVGEDVEHALVIADAGRPDAPAVDVPAFQAKGRAEVEPVDAVAGQFPVHQVLGMHDLHRRVHVHGGAGEVIVVADADDVGVLELLVEQRIRVGAVAVVGGPVLHDGRRTRRRGCSSWPARKGTEPAVGAEASTPAIVRMRLTCRSGDR